jgi:hypothetical protein
MYLPSLMLYFTWKMRHKISIKCHSNQHLKPFILRCFQCLCPHLRRFSKSHPKVWHHTLENITWNSEDFTLNKWFELLQSLWVEFKLGKYILGNPVHTATQRRKRRTHIHPSSGIWTQDPSVREDKTNALDRAATVIGTLTAWILQTTCSLTNIFRGLF